MHTITATSLDKSKQLCIQSLESIDFTVPDTSPAETIILMDNIISNLQAMRQLLHTQLLYNKNPS